MLSFETLYNEFENTRDLCKFCSDYKSGNTALRFLLIRSLDKPNLQELCILHSLNKDNNFKSLMKNVYLSEVSLQELLDYIESKRKSLIEQRQSELQGLTEILEDFPVVNCGVRNDKIDDIIKQLVRNKTIKSFDKLESQISDTVLPKIHQYLLWSYYNQTTNDLIEMFFLSHPSIIPTLRKIPNIDFFIKINGEIIPFDLKFTHISEEYFDIYSTLISIDPLAKDDFESGDYIKESQIIKTFYSQNKRRLNLPNFGSLSKKEMLDALMISHDSFAIKFVKKRTMHRSHDVACTIKDPHCLEWWNYKFQGERLFCNNNRFFIFLTWKDKFLDGRILKGRIEPIGRQVTKLLDNFSYADLHTIHYHYDKLAALSGDYTATAISTIYSE